MLDLKKTFFNNELVDPFIPEINSFVTRAEHFMRYIFAKKYLSRNKAQAEMVFDIACGNGYGSKILAEVGKKIIGFENSDHYLKDAFSRYKTANNQFVTFDLNKNNLSKFIKDEHIARPSTIICFETLEHIESPESLLKNFSTLLSKNGALILSVPNQKFEPKKKGIPRNIYHKHLFSEQQIVEMTQKAGFKNVKVYGQFLPNWLLHHSRWLIDIIDKMTMKSDFAFRFFAILIASPSPFLKNQSYSIILVATK